MIRCNLSVLLAEQNLKITKVSNETGISRTTLTSLANNNGQGIQFDTLNKLCMYLKVRPEEFFSYFPLNVRVSDISVNDKTVLISFDIEGNVLTTSTVIQGTLLKNGNDNIYLTIDLTTNNERDIVTLETINVLSQLPRTFMSNIESDIRCKISSELKFFGNVVITWNKGIM